MDLLNLGNQSRRTGIRPRANLTKDKYNMEDIDEFFSDEDDTTKSVKKPLPKPNRPSTSRDSNKSKRDSGYTQTVTPKDNIDNVARMINFTDAEAASFNLSPLSMSSKYAVKKKNMKSPLRSPLPERRDSRESKEEVEENADNDVEDFSINHGFDDFGIDDHSLSPVSLSPITKPKEKPKSKPKEKPKEKPKAPTKPKPKPSSLTKNMALGIGHKRRRAAVLPESDNDDDDDDDQNEDSTQDSNNFNDESSELLSPPPSVKKPGRRRSSQQPKEIITKASPLPSPPSDGLRRSRRTRIAPLAFWRGERIVYTRAFETLPDPDTTLANDIKKVPLQEIKEVVHIPDNSTTAVNTKKKHKSKTKNSKKAESEVYDYESDPEVTGSEWFADKALTLSVVEDDAKTNKLVAVAPNGGTFEAPRDVNPGLDNFKIASLFDQNNDFSATGLIEFPLDGAKSLRDSGDVIYNFHVVKGLIEVTLNTDKFVVTRGCSFQIPSRNTYGFKNTGNGPARLYFVQNRVPVVESDADETN